MYEDRIDEIIFYDITTRRKKKNRPGYGKKSHARFSCHLRSEAVSEHGDMYEVLKAGAEKISIDSMAVRSRLNQAGSCRIRYAVHCLSMQVRKVPLSDRIPSGYEVFLDGARIATGMDAVQWAKGERTSARARS